MDLTQRYAIDKDRLTCRIIGGEAIMLNLDNGYYYSLNKVGTKIWESINKQKSLAQILSLLKEKYRLPEKQLKMDLFSLMKDLYKEGLVRKI